MTGPSALLNANLILDVVGVPASIWFLIVVRRIYLEGRANWNRRPLVGQGLVPRRNAPWEPADSPADVVAPLATFAASATSGKTSPAICHRIHHNPSHPALSRANRHNGSGTWFCEEVAQSHGSMVRVIHPHRMPGIGIISRVAFGKSSTNDRRNFGTTEDITFAPHKK